MNSTKPLDYVEHITVDVWETLEDPWEIINGHPYCLVNARDVPHQMVCTRTLVEIAHHLQDSTIFDVVAQVAWLISNDTALIPDIVIVPTGIKTEWLEITPFAIFEVASAQTLKIDKTIKFDLYESQKVEYYIIINSEDKTTEFYSLNSEGKYEKQESSPVLTFDFEGCKVELDMGKVWKR